MKTEHAQLRGLTRGPCRANQQGCKPIMRFMKNEKMAIIKSFTFENSKDAYLGKNNLLTQYALKPNDLVRVFSNEIVDY